jgi:hypothetical protein
MKLRYTTLGLIIAIGLPLVGFAETAPTMQETSIKLFESLTPEQKQSALLPYDSPEKKSEVFTGGKRAGVQIKTLTPEQQKLAMDLLTAFTSDAGKQTAIAITLQKPQNPPDDPGFGRYYVCFFGEAGAGKTYAWRITEHHLTLVHVDVEKGEPTTFGPILIGANPPDLFDNEEEKMIALYGAMTAEERAKSANKGAGVSSMPPHGQSIQVADLNPTAKDAAKAVVDNRLAFFSAPIQREIKRALEANGGVDALEVSFYGEATKKCRDGGKWDFKMASKDFLCDYENSRAHIHLSLKSMPPKEK